MQISKVAWARRSLEDTLKASGPAVYSKWERHGDCRCCVTCDYYGELRVSVAEITFVAPPLSRHGDKQRKVNRGEREGKARVRDERMILRKETDFRAMLALEEGRRIKRSGMHILARRRTRDIKYALRLRVAQADGHYAWTMTHILDLRDAFDEEERKGYA